MVARRNLYWHISSLLWACLLTWHACVFAQTPQQKSDDVVRVFTELVQTDVMVFDKQDISSTASQRDNFEIKIDGQVRPIQFFEKISAGSHNEEAQLLLRRADQLPPLVPHRIELYRSIVARSIFFTWTTFISTPRGLSVVAS